MIKWRHKLEVEPVGHGLCSLAAAVLGAGALGAGASIYGATKAADAQTSATNASIAAQKDVQSRNANLMAPFIDAGKSGISGLQSWLDPNNQNNPLAALLRLTMPGANMSETLSQTPGYQFAEDKGLRAVNNQLAARGLGGSPGAVSKGAGEYVTGLASGTWQSVVDKLMGLFQSGGSQLQNLVGTGANAAGNLAGGNISSTGQVSNALIGQGNAQAGAATSIGSSIGNFGNSAMTAALMQKLLGNSGGAAPSTGIYPNPTGYPDNPWSSAGAEGLFAHLGTA